jgi:hypothetical protein
MPRGGKRDARGFDRPPNRDTEEFGLANTIHGHDSTSIDDLCVAAG